MKFRDIFALVAVMFVVGAVNRILQERFGGELISLEGLIMIAGFCTIITVMREQGDRSDG